MKVTLHKGVARGQVSAPPSKSYAHRHMVCAGLSDGVSRISGIAESEDMLATIDCLRTMGKQVTLENGLLTVEPGETKDKDPVYPCRESGSTLRFFLPLALVKGDKAVFTGSTRLLARGIGVYRDLFQDKGISVTETEDSILLNGRLTPGEYTVVGNVSSQFVSGLLFALPLLSGDSTLRILPPVESKPYIRMTVDVMKTYGVTVEEREDNLFVIPGDQTYRFAETAVEGDWSNAAIWLAMSALGGEVTVTGLKEDSLQGDKVCVEAIEALRKGHATVDVSQCPDLAPVLFAFAAAMHGGVFTGTRRLKIKESDRAAAMQEELKKFGISVDVADNRAEVYAGILHPPVEPLNGHNDHRIVMALALLCTVTGGDIPDAQAVGKSYPAFFRDLRKVGIQAEEKEDGVCC